MKKLVFFISAFFVLYTNTDAFSAKVAEWQDTRRPVSHEEWATPKYNNFVHLKAYTSEYSYGSCTAQYVAPNIIVSAGHCVKEYATKYTIDRYDAEGIPVKLLDYEHEETVIGRDRQGKPITTMMKDWALFLIENPAFYKNDVFNVNVAKYDTKDVSVMNAGWGGSRILKKPDLDKMRQDAANYTNFRQVLNSNYLAGFKSSNEELKASDSCYILNKATNNDVYNDEIALTIDGSDEWKDQSLHLKDKKDTFFPVDCVVVNGNSGGAVVQKDGKELYGVVSYNVSNVWFYHRGPVNVMSSSTQFMGALERLKQQYPLQKKEEVFEYESQKPLSYYKRFNFDNRMAGGAKTQQGAEFEEWKQDCKKHHFSDIGVYEVKDKIMVYDCWQTNEERAAAEKVAAEKAAAEKASKDKEAAEKAAAEKAREAEVEVSKSSEKLVTNSIATAPIKEKKERYMPGLQKSEDNHDEYIKAAKDMLAPDFDALERAAADIEQEATIVCEDVEKQFDRIQNMDDYELVMYINNAVYCQERKETLEKLQDAYDKAKAREQSLANRALTAATTAATGIGGMQLAQGLSEQKADREAAADMAVYIETMRCEYGNGKSVKAGRNEIELLGGNDEKIGGYRAEYFALANDLKERKTALGMKPGIESEEVLDKSNIGLYDDENTGITGGNEASLYRAQMSDSAADQEKLDELSATSQKRVKGGAIAAGAGVVGGAVGNSLINGKLGEMIKTIKKNKSSKENDETISLLKRKLKDSGVKNVDKLDLSGFDISSLKKVIQNKDFGNLKGQDITSLISNTSDRGQFVNQFTKLLR